MPFGIDGLTKAITHGLQDLQRSVDLLTRQVKEIGVTMPTRADIDAVKAAITQAISDAAARVSTDIQGLRDQLASGTPITDQDLADLQSDVTAIGQIDPAVVPAP